MVQKRSWLLTDLSKAKNIFKCDILCVWAALFARPPDRKILRKFTIYLYSRSHWRQINVKRKICKNEIRAMMVGQERKKSYLCHVPLGSLVGCISPKKIWVQKCQQNKCINKDHCVNPQWRLGRGAHPRVVILTQSKVNAKSIQYYSQSDDRAAAAGAAAGAAA